MNFNSFTPKEIKDRDSILFEIPLLGIPLTKRQTKFIVVGFVLGLILNLLGALIIPPTKISGQSFELLNDVAKRSAYVHFVLDVMVRFFILCSCVAIGLFFANERIQGKTYESLLIEKIKYKRNSGMILNEKAQRAILNKKGRR